jgi:hypothetical protein
MDDKEDILEILRNINQRLVNIEMVLTKQSISTEKMENHIEFVDNVYSIVKTPFCKALSLYHGSSINIDKENLLKDK